jgi:hypothetical protein
VNYELYVGLICMYCDAIRGVMVISVGQDHSYIITPNPFITLEAHRDPRRDAPEGRFGAISAISGCAPQVAVSDGLSGSDRTQAIRTSP